MARRGDGLVLRGKTWWLNFIHLGRRYQVRLGRNITKSVAREFAQDERALILRGERGIGEKKPKDLSFEKASEEFLRWAQANRKPRTYKNYRWLIEQLRLSFYGKNLSEIHPFLVEKHKQARIGAGARVSANRELTCLKTLFNRCIDWRKFEGENPVRRVKLVKEPKNRLRFLSVEEERQLVAAASEPLRTIILVGIHSGLRIESEALKLTWSDFDLKRGDLTVQAAYAKNGETRTIPMNAVLRDAFGSLFAATPNAEGVVFRCWKGGKKGHPIQSVRTAFTTACRHANVPGVSPHTLRHTFASRLAMAGVDIRTIQELGGWKEIKMVERYAHLSQKHKAEAVEKLVSQPAKNSTTVFTTSKKESA